MSLTFSNGTYKLFHEACTQSGLFGNFDPSGATSFKLECFEVSDSFELVPYKQLTFSVNDLEHASELGRGCFHMAFKGKDQDGNLWVVKKPLKAEHMKHIPTDVLKQQMAYKLSEMFSEITMKFFKPQEIFLRYLRPLLCSVKAIFSNGKEHKMDLFFELEAFIAGDFTYFNRPKGDLCIEAGKLSPNRLPQIFSRWTYDVSNGGAMVSDVQGCKSKRGQYWCTDPIVFTNFGFNIGLVDWGKNGMDNFRERYEKELQNNSSLKYLNSLPCFVPTEEQKNKMSALIASLAKLADKSQSRSLPGMVKRMLMENSV